MKKYRVDTFSDAGHKIKIFESRKKAEKYAKAEKKSGKITFLLEEVIDGLFEILAEV